VDGDGVLTTEVALPQELVLDGSKYGLEGVAELDDWIYLAFQAPEKRENESVSRILRYSPVTNLWELAYYPLAEGRFVTGLSPGPHGRLAVLERDKAAREASVHKKIFTVDPSTFEHGTLEKREDHDLVTLYQKLGIPVPEKPEGLAYTNGFFWIVNDNDSVKDSYGETVLVETGSNRLE
jgi:hypothetical protein